MYKGITILEESLQDEDKILKALIDRAQRLYLEDREFLDHFGHCLRDPQFAITAILDAYERVWIFFVRRSKSADTAQCPKARRALRQADRFLNFAAKVVSEKLNDSKRVFEHHKSQNSHSSRLKAASDANEIAERLASLTYNIKHRQLKKWQKISARCRRRIAGIWTVAAREAEGRARHPIETGN